RVEVFREALPLPADAGGERRAGDVLHTLHELDQVVLLARAHGREADAAVAHDDRRDAIPARRREVGVPRDLAVVVGVDVDPARRHELAARVELAARGTEIGPHRGDALAIDRDVRLARRGAAAVDHRT